MTPGTDDFRIISYAQLKLPAWTKLLKRRVVARCGHTRMTNLCSSSVCDPRSALIFTLHTAVPGLIIAVVVPESAKSDQLAEEMRVARFDGSVCRRAVLLMPLALFNGPAVLPAHAESERVTAQSVGIDQKNVGLLADPRALVDGDGIQPLIWGARERCDPTASSCKQGGVESDTGEIQPVPSREALSVSDRVRLEISVGGTRVGAVELGLWRSAAPTAVDTFVKLSGGRLVTNPEDEPASLERSVVARVLADRAVVLGALKVQGGSTVLMAGKTKPQRVPVLPPTTNDDTAAGGSHDAAGLLSVRRGGGSFEFSLTPRANVCHACNLCASRACARACGTCPSLLLTLRASEEAPTHGSVHGACVCLHYDARVPPQRALDADNVVIGQVLNAEGMAILERINTLPTDNYRSAPLATVRVERAVVL